MSDATSSAVSEFYAPREAPDLGDPALDPPMTVRVHRGEDRAVRYSPDALRAVKTSERTWLLVAGDTDDIGETRLDYEVRGWPVVAAVVNEAAFARHTPAPPTVLQPAERGDMDVDSFRG